MGKASSRTRPAPVPEYSEEIQLIVRAIMEGNDGRVNTVILEPLYEKMMGKPSVQAH